MRILHLADRLTDKGGAYHHLLGLIRHQARFHEVHLTVGRVDRAAEAVCPVSVVAGLDSRLRRPCELSPLLEQHRPDVVHLHNVVNPGVLEWAGAHRAVLTVQDHRSFCPGRGKWTARGELCREPMEPARCRECFSEEGYFREIYALTEERLRALARLRIVVLSRYMKGELVSCGLSGDAITVVPPFVHGLDPAATPDGPPCVAFVGRLVESKGVADALAAWRRSELRLPLVVAGSGPLRPALEREGCELLGWLGRERLSALYRRAVAVLLPSRWQEPFGIVGLEALTMGTPVAAWDAGGVREWHPTAGLPAWGDVDGLAAELVSAAGRPVTPPSGFEAEALMRRLLEVYRSA